ncbi:MAG: aspartate aminotransferase family protein [Myxococcota bacterium]|nr:aspartate aminotransferase family protein [Myxococcota bacterium]
MASGPGLIDELLAKRAGEQFGLHERYLNEQMVRVLRTIGFQRDYVEARGPYLFDSDGGRTLDLLTGFGVFALGRNHPKVVQALQEVLAADLPSLVQMDVTLLAGLLAERLVATTPPALDRVFFANSGTETVEAALKFARYATGRPGLVYCEHGYHGLTLGALSVNGEGIFQDGFGPYLPGCRRVPFDDLEALERALAGRDVAAFIVEPIQGHGVHVPSDDYLREAARLCREAGTLFVADEIQCGLGRTGRMWAVEHWEVEPDMICTAKALSGGFVPVGAVLLRGAIFDAVFSNMVRAPVHGSTFAKNNLAMAAGLATIDVIVGEGLVERARRVGESMLDGLRAMIPEFEFLHDVRGLGMMQALEFGPPKSLKLRAAWTLLEKATSGLFCQMVTIPLFRDHHILCQTAGHDQNVIKFLPTLTLSEEDRDDVLSAVRQVVADTHRVPGSVWDLGKTLAGHALSARSGRA